jgi:DNA-binding NarL/FixJ family response regulator
MMKRGVMKVLIMDDSATVRKRLIAMLSKIIRAENISHAEDAPGAINSIHKLDADPVIPDIRMPGGSQMDVLLKIKRNNQTLPVIALTDYPYRQHRRKYVEAGADFFFDRSTEFAKVMAVSRRLAQS